MAKSLLFRSLAAIPVATAILVALVLSQEDDARRQRNPWVPAKAGEYPYLCYVVRLEAKQENNKRFLCVIIGAKFVATHRTQLSYKRFSELQALNATFETVGGVSELPDYVSYKNVKNVQVQGVQKIFWETPVSFNGMWSQFFLILLKKSFKPWPGHLEIAPLLMVANWPFGHDELCTGIRWVHNNATKSTYVQRMHFWVRRANECGMSESQHFPVCVAGAATRGLCGAEPSSVVVMCQRALLGWHSRFDADPNNPRRSMLCGHKRDTKPVEIPPEYLRALAPRRYLIYHWLTGKPSPISMPSMAPMWLPFRAPAESRPGGEQWWPPVAAPSCRPHHHFVATALATALGASSTHVY